ncbi:MAG TPA: hypothetical protein VF575_02150 [Candidatus Saccharimonadales bacterium]|jgi:hypothetical protein
MKFPKQRTAASAGALQVPAGLQRAFVIAMTVSAAVGMAFTLALYIFNSTGYSWSYAAVIILSGLLPVIAFCIAYILSGRYPIRLNRWFVAIIKSAAFMAVYGVLVSLKNYSGIFFVGDSQPGSQPPAWVTSYAVDYVIMAVCVVAYLIILIRTKDKV